MKTHSTPPVKLAKWWKTPSAKAAMQRAAKAKRLRLSELRKKWKQITKETKP